MLIKVGNSHYINPDNVTHLSCNHDRAAYNTSRKDEYIVYIHYPGKDYTRWTFYSEKDSSEFLDKLVKLLNGDKVS